MMARSMPIVSGWTLPNAAGNRSTNVARTSRICSRWRAALLGRARAELRSFRIISAGFEVIHALDRFEDVGAGFEGVHQA